MSSLRHLWFDNRHLLGDAAGQRLLAALEALGARPREVILHTGDRLAAISLTLAQAFCRTAPAAWQAFGTTAFSRWVKIGEQLAADEPSSRDGAAAYFVIDPHALARLGLPLAEEWAAIGRDTLKISRRLGSQFLQTSAPLLATLPEPLPQRLRAWATHGSALLGAKGWKGEFLAVAYFDAAPVALPVLSAAEMAEWAKLGLLVQDAGPWTFYAKLPVGFATLTGPERLSLLRDCQAAAALSVKAAEESFFALPPVLAAQSPELRAFLLAVLAPVLRTGPVAVPSLVPLLVPLLKAVELERRPAVRTQLVALAQAFPFGVPPLLRALPRVWEETDEPGLTDWLTKGLEIARDNPAAGVAFFALESRTSEKVLHQASPGVDLDEVQELLRKYIHMLSGTTVGIRRQEGLSYPPPLEEFPTYSDDLPLPARVDMLPTYEENFRLLRVLAAHQAGRREFGTYDFSLSALWPRLPLALRQLLGEGENPLGGLPDYFRRFPHPDVVEALFLLLETQRVSAYLSEAYRGLREDLRWADSLTLPSLLPDFLVSLVATLPWPPQPHPTVQESALLAGEIYLRLLSSLAAARRTRDPASFDSIMFDKVTGDALIDPEMDDSPPPPEAPELPQLQLDPEADDGEGGTPLSPEELKALLEAGVDLQIRQGKQDTITPQGLYISDLMGKLPSDGAREDGALADSPITPNGQRRREREEGLTFFYDEWDYQIADYRARWCRLREIVLSGDAGEYFAKTLTDYATLRPAVKHEFQRIRPEQYRLVRGLEDGEEFDLNAVVTATSDLRARVSPSPKLYTMRRQTERDVAALFLLDMSASTDEPIVPVVRQYTDEDQDDWVAMWKKRPAAPHSAPRRIIDVTKEALVLMAEALEEIGDSYAIYGFSGQGKDNVEFYHIKSFAEVLSPTVKGRIGAIAPKRSTRMGAALRHSLEKLKDLACRVKLLVLLSDGFPQDMDYGADRRSITYGIRDTMMALREADRAGVLTFCLTIDKAGHDYLREMCEPSRYLVLDDVTSLPTELPKVYQRYIRPRGV
jgi:nitric oxide reductase NorD protein